LEQSAANNSGQDKFQLLAITTGTTIAPVLTGSGDDRMIDGNRAYSIVTSDNFTDLTEGGATSPVHPKTEKRRLWVSILMPTNISTSGTHSITLSVQAIVQ